MFAVYEVDSCGCGWTATQNEMNKMLLEKHRSAETAVRKKIVELKSVVPKAEWTIAWVEEAERGFCTDCVHFFRLNKTSG